MRRQMQRKNSVTQSDGTSAIPKTAKKASQGFCGVAPKPAARAMQPKAISRARTIVKGIDHTNRRFIALNYSMHDGIVNGYEIWLGIPVLVIALEREFNLLNTP